MFKVIKDNKIIGVSENEPVLLDNYEVEEDTDHNVDDFIHVDGEFVLKTDDRAIEVKKEQVRAVREQYFAEYVDFYQSKPLYWEEMTEEEKQDIAEYRNYLKDYTKEDNWWEQNPLTFEQWKEKKGELGATS